MRIGFIIYGSLETLSGGYLYDRKLVESLRAQGDHVEVVCLPFRNYAAHLADNYHVRLPPNLDILIQDELNHPSLIAANATHRSYPIISLVHHLRCSEPRPRLSKNFYRLIEKQYLRKVDGFIFNSRTTRESVHRLIGNGKPGMIAPPPSDRFGDSMSEVEVKARAATRPLNILFLGNLVERKGLHTLLDALTLQRENFNVDIVGSLEADSHYARAMQAKAAGMQSQVTFYGALDHEPLIERLKQAQVLVLPSAYEGFGIVYLEGMGFGLPAIGTTSGAASEIIEDGKTGYLIAANDASALAARLAALARDQDLLTRLSINALQRYRNQPKWETTAASIREFLQKMIA